MATLAFLLAAIEAALVAFGVGFPSSSPLENIAVVLLLLALGFLLPGALTFAKARRS